MNHPILFHILCAVLFFVIGAASVWLIKKEFGNTLYCILDKCMSVPEANSRLAFIVHSLIASFVLLFLGIAFVFVKDREMFPTMIGAVSGGGFLGAIGRLATKYGDGKQGDPGTTVQPPAAPGAPTNAGS